MAKQWIIGSATIYQPEQPHMGGWVATDSSYDGAPDGNNEMGHGPTYWEAWLDLMEQLA